MRKRKPKDPIPAFKNVEEEAEFWDTHSPLDYPEYWKEVKARSSRTLVKKGLTFDDPLGALVASATDAPPTDSSKKYEYLNENLDEERAGLCRPLTVIFQPIFNKNLQLI